MSHTLFRKNDNTIEWTWMSNSSDGGYVNDAVVTFTLYSGYSLNPATGVLMTPSASVNVLLFGPVTMAYVAGSNGKYQGRIAASLNLNIASIYTLEFNAVSGTRASRRSIPVTVVDRVT